MKKILIESGPLIALLDASDLPIFSTYDLLILSKP